MRTLSCCFCAKLKFKRWSLLVAVLLLIACDSGSGSKAVPAPEDNKPGRGYNALFVGHSFFQPVAAGMPSHAARAGIEGHTQQIVFSGGSSGSPQGLWENTEKRNSIQAVLDGGDVELFGMTYHPDYPSLEGYTNWVEYALGRNPHTKFLVAVPWPTHPATMDSSSYEAAWINGHALIHSEIIDALRATYPDNTFFCIPYGESSVDLYKLYQQGNLPDVERLISGGGKLGIYTDELGHPEAMLVDLSQLLWLQAIFNVDLATYNFEPGYFADLKTMAADIMARHDSAYNDQ